MSHPLVKGVSFTGGTLAGRTVAGVAASKLIKASLELGGKNATIVFSDKLKDKRAIRETADAVVRASFLNSGQVRVSSLMHIVEEAGKS